MDHKFTDCSGFHITLSFSFTCLSCMNKIILSLDIAYKRLFWFYLLINNIKQGGSNNNKLNNIRKWIFVPRGRYKIAVICTYSRDIPLEIHFSYDLCKFFHTYVGTNNRFHNINVNFEYKSIVRRHKYNMQQKNYSCCWLKKK